MEDRRAGLRLVIEGEAFFDNVRAVFDLDITAWFLDLLATRGDRLALFRLRLVAADGNSGQVEVEYLDVVEVDEHGARAAEVTFDPEDLDAAYDELDARYIAGEGAPHATQMEANQRFMGSVPRREIGRRSPT